MKKSAGFTLIELLMVIAVMGILSAVILATLNTARSKGNDAKVKSQISGARLSAEIYFDNWGYNYGSAVTGAEAAGGTIGTGCNSGMFATGEMSQYTSAANYPSVAAGTGKCTSNGRDYAISARLTDDSSYWCVDSRGTSKATAALQADGIYTCP